MSASRKPNAPRWSAIPDPEGQFSTGITDFDRLLGGGLARGSMALFACDASVGPAERELLLTPLILNFLHHSNGVMAVLPARESPQGFRSHVVQWVGRRRFDTRVRVIDYVGEGSEAPYVVHLRAMTPGKGDPKRAEQLRAKDMQQMAAAESAVRGARARPFIELVAFEILETIAGPELAPRMLLHGIKRTRAVGNLGLGILRPGLTCADAVRSLADVEFSVTRNEIGLVLKGVRPATSAHLVLPDPQRGAPYVALVPAP
ncbi:MAG TPA: gas vesicle protein GvpD basic region 2 domain-containing protein [Thermoplasmata archaeon]|nr:gas vesicle protein GvpD basic region 2 domain-containing protein [Thermoplasmata archaeon]